MKFQKLFLRSSFGLTADRLEDELEHYAIHACSVLHDPVKVSMV